MTSKKCITDEDCERACKAKNGHACTIIGERFFEGMNEHPLDHERAYEFLKTACDLDHAHGCALLGFQYQDGLGVEWSPQKAIESYEKACRLGAGVGCFNLATIYEGHGVDPDLKRVEDFYLRAQEHWNRACNGDEPRWCTNAAYMISKQANNKPGADDLERMLEMDDKTCKSGVLVGCTEKVRVLEDLKRIDAPKVTEEMLDLCKRGEPTACTYAGALLLAASEAGTGPDRDAIIVRGNATLERGCKIGDKYACSQLAFASISGKHRKQDFDAAERYFLQACDRAHATSCGMIAERHRQVPAKHASAAAFARRSCQMGDGDGCMIIAELAFAGQGVAKSDDDGVKWSREACQRGKLLGCKTLVEREQTLPVPKSQLPSLHAALCKDGVTSSCVYKSAP